MANSKVYIVIVDNGKWHNGTYISIYTYKIAIYTNICTFVFENNLVRTINQTFVQVLFNKKMLCLLFPNDSNFLLISSG